MTTSVRTPSARGLGALLLTGAIAALASGCATRADVSGQSAIATARYAIITAENAQAGQYAPDDLERARQKVAEAEKLVEYGEPNAARRSANEATAEAKLAAARSRQAVAEAALAEANRVRRENEALRSEAREAEREQQR